MYSLIIDNEVTKQLTSQPTLNELLDWFRKEFEYEAEDFDLDTTISYKAEGSVKDYWEDTLSEVYEMLILGILIEINLEGESYFIQLKSK